MQAHSHFRQHSTQAVRRITGINQLSNEQKRNSLSLLVGLLLVELAVLLSGGILVLLVLGHEIVHVGLSLGEFHLVHALASVPVKERLSSEHGGELLTHALEELLDGGRVTNEGSAHLEASRRDVADSGLDVVRDPLNKVRAVLVLSVEHLLVDLLHGHASSEHGGDGQVSSVSRVASSHHVLGIEHLLGERGNGTMLTANFRRSAFN